ncbi:T-cell-specific surface glycoprotein CD28 [Rana temporaria]|uniref:T-cell-specific surface glycoprotein CD28 n=1 Tax=Rana temporaria TaxID=8407 RepID=UPI001AAE1337|nr:T-cell-specific surface glycoprotein CD28 [Rana temporaria]
MVLWIILTGLVTLVQCKDTVSRTQGYIRHEFPGNIKFTFPHDAVNDTFEELKVSLNKGFSKTETVCVVFFNSTQIKFEENNCRVKKVAHEVTFSLWVNNTDIYFFHKERMFPPPYKSEWDNGTIIHIKEPKCNEPEIKKNLDHSLSLFIALGCFALYSIIITTAFLYIVRKGRRTRIQQSEYINVVPRRPRPHLSCVAYATTPAICHSR